MFAGHVLKLYVSTVLLAPGCAAPWGLDHFSPTIKCTIGQFEECRKPEAWLRTRPGHCYPRVLQAGNSSWHRADQKANCGSLSMRTATRGGLPRVPPVRQPQLHGGDAAIGRDNRFVPHADYIALYATALPRRGGRLPDAQDCGGDRWGCGRVHSVFILGVACSAASRAPAIAYWTTAPSHTL